MKTLYQIQNSKSGRRLIYKGFNKYEWSEGNGEDGTFFKEEEMEFILGLIPKHQSNEISIIRYEIREFGNGWPIPTKRDEERIRSILELDL